MKLAAIHTAMDGIFKFAGRLEFTNMYFSILLVMVTASAMAQISMATMVAKNDNGGYKALMTDTQQQQQQRQRELNGAFNQLQLDKKRHQQQQPDIQQIRFEPFDFANLRRLQLKYKNGQSYGSQGQQEQLQQQQQHRQQISHYAQNKGVRDQDNEDANNNSNNDYSSYYSYSLGNDVNDNIYQQNNKNFDNNNNNKANSNGNPNRDVVDDNDYEQQHQDARNSFRLQSSDSNEPYSSSNNNNNYKNTNNDGEENSNIAGSSSSSKSKNLQKVPISFGEMEFYDDLESDLPYGIQNVKRVPRRNNENGGRVTTYQSLCPTKRISISLETASYEYRPNHYVEVNCAHNYSPSHGISDYNKNKICSEAGFSCIQLNRTIHLIRRSKESPIDCWESEIRIVPSGCECMWPKHHFGDIRTYHQEQKRQNSPPLTPATTRLGELGHIESGDYLEIPVEMVIDATGQERTKNKIIDIYERN